MKKRMMVLMIAVALMLPAGAIAMKGMDHGDHGKKEAMGHDMKKMDHGDMKKMDHGDMKKMDHGDMKKMDHGSMKKMDHGSMGMDGKMIMLQDHEVDGVMGSAHMLDVKEKMAEHGMSVTHHIMVGFMDTEGNPIEKGSAAVKIESPDETVGKPIKMMGMDGAFGADITLDQKGMYHFKIGTKLPDGKKRTFHYHYEN